MQTLTFKTTEERDAYIDAIYPKRKCLGAPGTYRVSGGTLSVFMREVTFTPNPRREYSADEVIRRENLSKPTRDYPGADQMMRWQRDYK